MNRREKRKKSKELNILSEVITIINQYFLELIEKFEGLTDLSITNKNIEESIYLGRKRWKIENEGFNIQKNGTFDIGHLYSKDSIAIKVHYLMIQIAHIIRQLLENGVKK